MLIEQITSELKAHWYTSIPQQSQHKPIGLIHKTNFIVRLK